MIVRHYAGSIADAILQLDEIANVSPITKAYFTDDNRLLKSELIDAGVIVYVDYYDSNEHSDLRGIHEHNYRGVQYALHAALDCSHGYEWERISSFNTNGELTGTSISLTDPQGNEIMSIEFGPSGGIDAVTKYFWNENGELRYAFEYNDEDQVVGYDLLYGDQQLLSELQGDLPDYQFYLMKLQLPLLLADTKIPARS